MLKTLPLVTVGFANFLGTSLLLLIANMHRSTLKIELPFGLTCNFRRPAACCKRFPQLARAVKKRRRPHHPQ